MTIYPQSKIEKYLWFHLYGDHFFDPLPTPTSRAEIIFYTKFVDDSYLPNYQYILFHPQNHFEEFVAASDLNSVPATDKLEKFFAYALGWEGRQDPGKPSSRIEEFLKMIGESEPKPEPVIIDKESPAKYWLELPDSVESPINWVKMYGTTHQEDASDVIYNNIIPDINAVEPYAEGIYGKIVQGLMEAKGTATSEVSGGSRLSFYYRLYYDTGSGDELGFLISGSTYEISVYDEDWEVFFLRRYESGASLDTVGNSITVNGDERDITIRVRHKTLNNLPIGTEVDQLIKIMMVKRSDPNIAENLPWEPSNVYAPNLVKQLPLYNPESPFVRIRSMDGAVYFTAICDYIDDAHMLCGLPVYSGGNFMDENGKRWKSNTINMETNMVYYYVGYKEVASLQMDTADLSEKGRFIKRNFLSSNLEAERYTYEIFCNAGKWNNGGIPKEDFSSFALHGRDLYFSPPKGSLLNTLDRVNKYLSEYITDLDGQTFQIIYLLKSPAPISIPSEWKEELSKIKTLEGGCILDGIEFPRAAGIQVSYKAKEGGD